MSAVVLKGVATLRFEDQTIEMKPGKILNIPEAAISQFKTETDNHMGFAAYLEPFSQYPVLQQRVLQRALLRTFCRSPVTAPWHEDESRLLIG